VWSYRSCGIRKFLLAASADHVHRIPVNILRQTAIRKGFPLLVIFLATVAADVCAADFPAWAFPVNPSSKATSVDDGSVLHVPDSSAAFTRKQLLAIGGRVCDWHPDEHPEMPLIVAQSREPAVYACGYCHLPSGAGRPENASLAGLTHAYIKGQMAAFRSGDRVGSESRRAPENAMIAIAKAATDAEIEAAAVYFSRLNARSFVRVIETDEVPRTVVAGWTFKAAPEGGAEPIGHRIIEMPEDFERFERRDPRTPYVAYVPVGSLKRGAGLVTTSRGGATALCSSCHGPDLKGLADVPRLSGRSPSYLMRQLFDIRNGTRHGGTAELMKPNVANLSDDDLIAISAYLASLDH
jgi:cytochrome c553